MLVGAVDYFVPMYLKTQLLLFGALVAALVLIGRRVYGSFGAEPGPLPQSRAHAMIGQNFFLDEAIVRGFGRIRVGDSSWRVAGRGLPGGDQGPGGRGRGRLAPQRRARRGARHFRDAIRLSGRPAPGWSSG